MMDKDTFKNAINEFKELSDRTNKCRDFILNEEKFNKLDMINRDLLIAQLKAMETYLSILSIRLGINGADAEKNKDNSENNSESVDNVETSK